jgi:predicted acyltransferase (DUF342 family)
MADVNAALKGYLSDTTTPLQSMLNMQTASMRGDELDNFNNILKKYPGMSNDLVMSAVRQGLTAETPGLGKISSIDGIAALKTDAFKLDKIKSAVKPNRGIVGSIQDVAKHWGYEPLKGTTRLAFAALRSPYDMLTTVGRDITALARGEKGASEQTLKDLGQGIFGESTVLGQITRNLNNGTGSGFFVGPESKVGKAQAKEMAQFGLVNGKSFTIGRGIFNGVGMNPNSNAYSVLSGIVDATLNVAADPSTWFGPGAVGKIITQGKTFTKISKEVTPYTKSYFDDIAKEGIESLKKEGSLLEDKLSKKFSSGFKRIGKDYKAKEQEVIASEQKIVNKQVGTAQKLLNFESNKWMRWAFEPADTTVKQTLSNKSISEWFVNNPKTQTGELTQAMDLLSADMKNTGGFFDGHIILDEVPQYGKVSVGAHGMDEYVVTANDAKKLKLLDLADNFMNSDDATRAAEAVRRSKFADALDKLGKKATDPDAKVYSELANNLRDGAANLEGFVGSLFTMGDLLVEAKPLGALIGEVADFKNFAVMSKITSTIEKIWKADGYTNVRSIYGKEGGVVITRGERIAATRAEIGNAAAEFADPTNLGPNVAKLVDSIQDTKASIAARQNELDDLLAKQLDLEGKETYFKLLREKANGDPDILRELIQDPANAGIKGFLKIEAELADNAVLRESIHDQIGITDGFMGNVLDTPGVEKGLRFILGRQFQPIAELIAKETDVVKLRRLFNRKLSDDVIKELADAESVDDVFKVFANQLAPGQEAMLIKQSLSAGLKIATNPAARILPGVNMRAVRYAENLNKAFGRFYIRSTAVSLSDTTQVNNVVEDWISSIGLTSKLGNIITKGAQEKIIADTQRAVFKATTNAEKAAAVSNGIGNLMDEVGRAIGLEPEKIVALKNSTKLSGKEQATYTSYSLGNVVGNKGGAQLITAEKTIDLPDGILESQLLNDVINFPDSREINKAIVGYKTNSSVFGAVKATKILLEEYGDMWRTAQLVFRVSYIARNIAEMQMRQFFSGHNSLFNNPVGFIAMMVADPEGNAIQQMVAKRSKLGVNALGESMKTTDAEVEFSESIIARRALMRGTSRSDYDSAQRKKGILFKAYNDITSEHPDFLQGLAWTINNFSSDKFMPDVIRILNAGGSPESQAEYVDNLIATFDEPGNKLKEFASAVYEKNTGMREVLLKSPSKEIGPGVVAENINRENVLTWLFDTNQPDTVAGQLNLLGGQGTQRNLIMDLIRDGKITVTNSKGKLVTITAPYRQKGLTTDGVIAAEGVFEKQVAALFKAENLQGSVVKNLTEKYITQSAVGKGKEWIDIFFNYSARAENKFNFGPEFDASYWDFIAGYADMLSTDDLIKLRANANKAFAPTSKGGKKIIGRVPAPLRTINNTLKKRQANPNYVHQGGTSLRTLDSIAAKDASNYVKNLFYDAAQQKQWANAARLVAPFAQAHYNTIGKWSELTTKNPAPIYKAGKAFDALTKEGSNTIYDVTGMTHDDNQGFFYKDEGEDQIKFKMPLAGNIIGALAGGNLQGLQITSPLESLNLAFGSVNPLTPGMGPAIGGLYQLSGRSATFGPADDFIRDIITPFGQPKTPTDIIFPSWLKKASEAILGNDAVTQRNVKDWAGYLASTGDYGDNPLASDATRVKLFNDAEGLAKGMNFWSAIFQSISPTTPIQEVLIKVKNPNNKMNFMTMTMLSKQWNDINDMHPGDRVAATTEFANKFGIKNLLIAVSGSTPGTSGSGDAWTFLNNNPGTAEKYATPTGDIMPYFFPGGEYSLRYYNWQKRSGSRRPLSSEELAQEAEGLVYSMLKGQIAENQIAGRYTDYWYNEQIAKLDKEFGGAKPADTIITGVNDQKVANVELALKDPIFQKSPVYEETAEFYGKFSEFKQLLNLQKASNYAELSAGGIATLMRNELVTLGEKLMQQNPEFSRMYYGVFAGILKEA